jgi:hypothetical protein
MERYSFCLQTKLNVRWRAFPECRLSSMSFRASHVRTSTIKPKSVLVSFPYWEESEVPAAYRVLMYEHLIDRLAHIDGISHIYRDGEDRGPGVCPQYTIHIAVTGFKQGSQVQRAVTGPVGFFVGTTQMRFDTSITDASGSCTRRNILKRQRGASRKALRSRTPLPRILQNTIPKSRKLSSRVRWSIRKVQRD